MTLNLVIGVAHEMTLSRRYGRERVGPSLAARRLSQQLRNAVCPKVFEPVSSTGGFLSGRLAIPINRAATQQSEYGLLVFECRLKTPDSITHTAEPPLTVTCSDMLPH